MNYPQKSGSLATAALLILTSLSGCGDFAKGAGFKAPPLDPRDEATCPDPGVGNEAVTSLAENRVALADCRQRHTNVVRQYNEVRGRLGSSAGPA